VRSCFKPRGGEGKGATILGAAEEEKSPTLLLPIGGRGLEPLHADVVARQKKEGWPSTLKGGKREKRDWSCYDFGDNKKMVRQRGKKKKGLLVDGRRATGAPRGGGRRRFLDGRLPGRWKKAPFCFSSEKKEKRPRDYTQ